METRYCFAVTTKTLPATNNRGTRIKAVLPSGRGITVGWDHALDTGRNHEAAARALCALVCYPGQEKGPCFRALMPEASPYSFCFVFPEASANVTEGRMTGGVAP